MTATKIALIYTIAGSGLLYACLKLFRIDFKAWQPIATCVIAALCILILPSPYGEIASLSVSLIALKLLTGEEWQEIIYPLIISRLALVPVMIAINHV